MTTSLTWQALPEWLQEPLQNSVLTLAEAAELWDRWLLTPDGEVLMLPPHLYSAAEKLCLWEMPASPTRH